MGSWGYGYTDGDHYFNERAQVIQPLFGRLRERLDECRDWPDVLVADYRTELMTVVDLCRKGEVESLETAALETLTESVTRILAALPAAKSDWKIPEELVKVVTQEMQSVTDWVSGFTEASSLLDRLPALFDAIGGQQADSV